MRCAVVIPAHNEADRLAATLDSLLDQRTPPERIVVVDDHSTDATPQVIEEYASNHPVIIGVSRRSAGINQPGAKVVNAFYSGYEVLEDSYDLICKFDADLIFPPDYLGQVIKAFEDDPRCGIAGGFCYIQKGADWVLEGLTDDDHIRGALKCYRKECFEQIGGLRRAMGWDTVDELLARFHSWKVVTLPELKVRHLKPTGAAYRQGSARLQGRAFRTMRYGLVLSTIALIKLAFRKKQPLFWIEGLIGFLGSGGQYLVSAEEGKFIRGWRWQKIKKKLFHR